MTTATSSAPLTIVIPFYKNAEYLRRALDSVFAQPLGEWSLLVVDNSQDDAERAAVADVLALYPEDSITCIKNDAHLDACASFNRCIDLSPTDLTAVVHGDDEVLPNFAQEMTALACRHPGAAVIFGAVRIIDENSRPCFSFVDWAKSFLMPTGQADYILFGEAALRSIARGNWLNAGPVCYRKSRLGDLRWDSRFQMTGDLNLWARTLLSGRTMAGAKRPPVYLYRRHGTQTTAELTASLYRFREESLALDIIAERAAAQGWHSAAGAARRKTIVRLHLVFLALRDALKGSLKDAYRKAAALRELGA